MIFSIFGHENLLGTHKTTLEFTKDKHLTLNGDCIVGVNATFSYDEIMKLVNDKDKFKIILKFDDMVEEINCDVNKDFCDKEEIVIRKSEFISDRTLGINADKAAIDLNRGLINKLKDPNTKIMVEFT